MLITGDCNTDVTDKNLIPLIEAYEEHRRVKKRSSQKGVIFSQNYHSSMKSQSFDTGCSVHHLIYTVLKATVAELPQSY